MIDSRVINLQDARGANSRETFVVIKAPPASAGVALRTNNERHTSRGYSFDIDLEEKENTSQ